MAGTQTSRITTAPNQNLVIQPAAGKQTKITSITANNPGTTPLACDNTTQAIKKFVITDLPVKNTLADADSLLVHDTVKGETRRISASNL